MPTPRVLITAAIVAVLLTGCQSGSSSKSNQKNTSGESTATAGDSAVDKAGMRKFTDPDGLFTVRYPGKWYANGGSSLAVEISPLRANTNLRSERNMSVPSIELVAGTAKQNVTDYAGLVESSVKAWLAAKPAAIRGKVRSIEISGSTGAWTDVQMSSKTGEQVHVFMAMGGVGKKRMQMFGFSPPDDWQKNVKIFKAVAESFEFKGSGA